MPVSRYAFDYVADLVRRETAMVYETGKEYLVEARLVPLMRRAGDDTLEEYVARVRGDRDEQRRVLDALTINETSWFRDQTPFRVLRETVLPDLLSARNGSRHLSFWSAACSSGQEPYSIAMLLREELPPGWSTQILATDVSTSMVQRTREGIYSQVEMNRGLPATSLLTYFHRAVTKWEIAADLRAMVEARELNLAGPFPVLPIFDVVFCRNVLIYFDTATKYDVLQRLSAVVAPDGYLVLGTGEASIDIPPEWSAQTHGRVRLLRRTGAALTATTHSQGA